MKIWSKRFSPALGNHWKMEREVVEADAQAWLTVFRCDEPSVTFLASKRKPAK